MTTILTKTSYIRTNGIKIVILALYFALSACGQTRDKDKDTRAKLNIEGGIDELSVSPDEKIWLVTSTGNTYYTENIDSNWHYGKPIYKKATDDSDFGNPNLERISFFNKDTAILTGYISADKGNSTNGYYLTTDAGKSWKRLDYGGDSWIYTIHTDKTGNAWMGGSKKELYHSNNYGRSWTTLKLPYNSSDRTYCVYMSNSKSGIASSEHNEIITTEDNWKTVTHLKTPLDQEKYKVEKTISYVDDRISKILKWKNYIVVNQSGHIFYSDAKNVEWKSFPVKIFDFEVNQDSQKLFAITDSLKVIAFSSPTEYKPLTNKQLSSAPIDMKVVNHSVYVLCGGYEVFKVNENGLRNAIAYTTDEKISKPQIVKKFSKLTWGITYDQIYLAEDSLHNWFREKQLEFSVSDFMLISDSTAILWDGTKNNYLYSLRDHIAKIYYPKNPLQNFITSPVKYFSINSGSKGCYHRIDNDVNYQRIGDSIFTTSNIITHSRLDKQISTFKNTVKSDLLSTILASIDSAPSAVPSLTNFKITKEDKKNYWDLVNKQLKSKEMDFLSDKKKINKKFYYAVPTILDTLNHSIIKEIFDQPESIYSTTSNWFKIEIINQNNDTLHISRRYYAHVLPWNLPWKFEYKGLNFNCYNIEFSRFINSCIPNDFIDKEIFDNKLLIMEIADYLYNKPQQ